MKSLKQNQNLAFSMIELSVVILIIALLMFGSFSSSGIVNSAKEKVTKDRMKVIYEEMGKFLLQKKRLPCPASIKLPRGDINYGKEIRSSSQECYTTNQADNGVYSSNATDSLNLVYGMVPIYDLNLGADFAEDAFGNKINYFMDKRFAYNFISAPDQFFSLPSFGTAKYNDIFSIKERNQGGEIIINSDAIIVLMSAGVNGFGAFKNNGIQNPRSTTPSPEEIENDVSNLTSDAEHFNKVFYKDFESEEVFDDIVFFKTRNDFVDNFNAKFLIPCKGVDITDTDFDKISKYYDDVLVASSPCPLEAESVKKTIKCGAFGKWNPQIVSCPGIVINTCTVGGNSGMRSKIVNANTSSENGECEIDYKGSYSWSCSSAGEGSIVANNCIAYCVFASQSGMQGQKGAPGEVGQGSCSTGYIGSYSWQCSSSGVGSILVNNCVVQ
jgi:type II secretory pathway pseudopilin PulG